MAEATTGEEKMAPKRAHEEEEQETEPSKKVMKLPQKKYYRQRAHANPLSFQNLFHPKDPDSMNWDDYFGPKFQGKRDSIRNVDVGCGYGGLLFKLSKVYPEECSVGLEIREKVSRFVKDKIQALRHNEEGDWQNICCFRTNAMQYICHFFAKAQLERMFFLFPDPHFKKKKAKWRIIQQPLITEYAYLMKTGGLLYTVTDVLQYHEWVLENFAATKLFTKISDEELKDDPIFPFLFESSEEAQKVTRNEGDKYHAIYRRTEVESVFTPDLNKDYSSRCGSTIGAGSDNEIESDDEEEKE